MLATAIRKLDKRVVLLDTEGMYHIQGVWPADADYPPALEDANGYACHHRTTARAIIYRELTQKLSVHGSSNPGQRFK